MVVKWTCFMQSCTGATQKVVLRTSKLASVNFTGTPILASDLAGAISLLRNELSQLDFQLEKLKPPPQPSTGKFSALREIQEDEKSLKKVAPVQSARDSVQAALDLAIRMEVETVGDDYRSPVISASRGGVIIITPVPREKSGVAIYPSSEMKEFLLSRLDKGNPFLDLPESRWSKDRKCPTALTNSVISSLTKAKTWVEKFSGAVPSEIANWWAIIGYNSARPSGSRIPLPKVLEPPAYGPSYGPQMGHPGKSKQGASREPQAQLPRRPVIDRTSALAGLRALLNLYKSFKKLATYQEAYREGDLDLGVLTWARLLLPKEEAVALSGLDHLSSLQLDNEIAGLGEILYAVGTPAAGGDEVLQSLAALEAKLGNAVQVPDGYCEYGALHVPADAPAITVKGTTFEGIHDLYSLPEGVTLGATRVGPSLYVTQREVTIPTGLDNPKPDPKVPPPIPPRNIYSPLSVSEPRAPAAPTPGPSRKGKERETAVVEGKDILSAINPAKVEGIPPSRPGLPEEIRSAAREQLKLPDPLTPEQWIALSKEDKKKESSKRALPRWAVRVLLADPKLLGRLGKDIDASNAHEFYAKKDSKGKETAEPSQLLTQRETVERWSQLKEKFSGTDLVSNPTTPRGKAFLKEFQKLKKLAGDSKALPPLRERKEDRRRAGGDEAGPSSGPGWGYYPPQMPMMMPQPYMGGYPTPFWGGMPPYAGPGGSRRPRPR
jgi:hypothetical protein